MSRWTLCIDFGTAFSKAAAAPLNAWMRFDAAAVRPLAIGAIQEAGHPFLLDSAVFVDDDRILFGRAAIARAEMLAHKKRQAVRSFKTLLAVDDLERALNTNASLSLDPHKLFQMRDLVVLYLAYLQGAVEAAAIADPILSRASSVEQRYAAPAWRDGDVEEMHDVVVRLFAEAEAFRLDVGPSILDPDGVPLDVVTDALARAEQAPVFKPLGMIFEASAAAAYSSIGLDHTASHFIVVDMGAGTTDIAALARVNDRLIELPNARITFQQAGDFLDRVIANLLLASGKFKKTAQQAEAWRPIISNIRELKETLFAEGKVTYRHRTTLLSTTLRDLSRDKDFQAFYASLQEAFDAGLAVVCTDAMKRKAKEVQAIAVGGGAAGAVCEGSGAHQIAWDESENRAASGHAAMGQRQGISRQSSPGVSATGDRDWRRVGAFGDVGLGGSRA